MPRRKENARMVKRTRKLKERLLPDYKAKQRGIVVVLQNPRCKKPYYDISLGHLAACAEWRGS